MAAVSAPFPVPLGTPSHLRAIFNNMYLIFSRDPQASPAVSWSLPPQATVTTTVSGATITLFMVRSDTGASSTAQYNLANDGSGGRPTVQSIVGQINASLNSFFSGLTPTASATAVGGSTLSALTLVEGSYPTGIAIPYATSVNYCLMRVMALLWDLIQADQANMYAHMTVMGAQGIWLDWLGSFYGVLRLQPTAAEIASGATTEQDDDYRRRITRALIQPYNNNVAIALILQQQLNVTSASITDYASPSQTGLFTLNLSQQPSISTSQIVGLVNRHRAPGTTLASVQVTALNTAFSAGGGINEDASSASSGGAATQGGVLLPVTGTNASSSGAASTASLGTKKLNGVSRLYTGSGVVF